MKKIFYPLIALLISIQANAAIYQVQFVDANNKEPQLQPYDQHCQLTGGVIDSIGGPPTISNFGSIPNNVINLQVGDKLEVKCPVNHSRSWFARRYSYRLENISMNYPCFNALSLDHDYYFIALPEEDFENFSFTAERAGSDSLNIHFAKPMALFESPIGTREGPLLGHISVNVTENPESGNSNLPQDEIK